MSSKLSLSFIKLSVLARLLLSSEVEAAVMSQMKEQVARMYC